MESSGEAGDDQGSGWLQVKKKHRNSSKFSLQGWIGGSSGTQASGVLHCQPSFSVKGGTSKINSAGQTSRTREDCVAHDPSNSNCIYGPEEDKMGVCYLDKRVVSQGECSSLPVVESINTEHSDCTAEYDQDIPQNSNGDVLPKIKWGNLDDSALLLHHGNTIQADIKFGDIGNDNLASRKADNVDDSLSSISASTEPKENKFVATSVETEDILQESLSLSPKNEYIVEKCKEVKEVSLEDVKVKIVNEKEVSRCGDVSSYRETHQEHIKEINSNLSGCGQSSALTEPALKKEEGDLEVCGVPVTNVALSSTVVSDDFELPPREKTGLEISGGPTVTASTEDSEDQPASLIFNELSKVQIMGAIDAGESKERFRQRLWCFLFENLNRAVDELYLLCELECDLEQMNEACLVLEEAASDFKELYSRVEEFEKVKRSCSQVGDEPPMTMKAEHRRPHALSWEVRRMTTSPRRAEILSSSLEAFKKIQQERAVIHAANDSGKLGLDNPNYRCRNGDILKTHTTGSNVVTTAKELVAKPRKQIGVSVLTPGGSSREKRNVDSGRFCKINSAQNGRYPVQNQSVDSTSSRLTLRESSLIEKNLKSVDSLKRQSHLSERDKERRNDPNGISFKSMDAWKQKRNWEDILASPLRVSSRFSHSPGMSRKSAERARTLHDKLMSPEKKKKTTLDLKKEADEKHARAMRIRSELENERIQKFQLTSKKLNRVNELQAVRSTRLREGMHARHRRSESRHEAHLAEVSRRAGDESSKVNEVRFITSLNEENKKLMLLQKHHDSELRRAEKIKDMKIKLKEDMAREEAVLERKKLIEAEKLQRLTETQRKKEEAQLRREEERKASSAAREAKAMEQMRRKEVRAKAQQEEAELLAQKLAERLSESVQRRKYYLEQIRERASMDFRDQSSPLLRRSMNKESQSKFTVTNCGEIDQMNRAAGSEGATFPASDLAPQHSLKRRIKKIRQRLMALKYELPEPSVAENSGIGYRAAVGTARAKIGRWLQELQRHRQARKEGAASFGLVTAEMVKFLEGKDPELQASRQAGLLDFIASALPASHTSKPEACQVIVYLLRLLRVVLSLPANRSYFLAQNLLPPLIPMLAAALENFIKITASSVIPGCTNLPSSKTSIENSDSISEVLDGFLWTVAAIIGHSSSDEQQLQMQDVLLELVVAYQVIHRLRDLFALYDRPQVEGSPFPSSILLSINLLAILTSKFRTISSIDWESFPIETMPINGIQETKLEVADLGGSSSFNLSGNSESTISAPTNIKATLLPDIPEEQSIDESRNTKRNGNPKSLHENECAPDESQSGVTEYKPTVIKKDEKNSIESGTELKNGDKSGLKQPVEYLLLAISETGLVCLPSLLTAVLLQANNRLSSEQASYVLPSNFEEVATGVLKVLNNLALLDINFVQSMLARADLKMEFFHLMSFLLSHCTSKWVVATDQTGLLLLESLLLLGYFALFHPENQAVLRWGKSPTILHKVCDLPFVFFSDPELMPVLAGTLVAACFGCELNKGVVQQELSMDMLLSLLRSCKSGLPSFRSCSTLDNPPIDESMELNQSHPESKKLLSDSSQRSNRYNLRSTRAQSVKGTSFGNSTRNIKTRNQKDGKPMKLYDEMAVKHNLSTSETSSNLMLHSRFPVSFIDRAEQFFSTELPA